MSKRVYTTKDINAARVLASEGVSLHDASRRTGISRGALQHWQWRFNLGFPKAPTWEVCEADANAAAELVRSTMRALRP